MSGAGVWVIQKHCAHIWKSKPQCAQNWKTLQQSWLLAWSGQFHLPRIVPRPIDRRQRPWGSLESIIPYCHIHANTPSTAQSISASLEYLLASRGIWSSPIREETTKPSVHLDNKISHPSRHSEIPRSHRENHSPQNCRNLISKSVGKRINEHMYTARQYRCLLCCWTRQRIFSLPTDSNHAAQIPSGAFIPEQTNELLFSRK